MGSLDKQRKGPDMNVPNVKPDMLYSDWLKQNPKIGKTVKESQFYRTRAEMRGTPYRTNKKKSKGVGVVSTTNKKQLFKIVGDVDSDINIEQAKKLLGILSGEQGLLAQKVSILTINDGTTERVVLVTSPK